ncbi:MAG: CLASP N terminal domain-containing protein [Amphiamblys sp. WSBS2006]|nr:MAG: CLASP N terminal domain-containing protein [Amphiamblys sp. WSBS2006]
MAQSEECEALKRSILSMEGVFGGKVTETNWEKIEKKAKEIRETLVEKKSELEGCDSVVGFVNTHRDVFVEGIGTDRTRLAMEMLGLAGQMAAVFGEKFVPLAGTFLPAIIRVCSKTNRILVARGVECASTMVQHCSFLKECFSEICGGMKTNRPVLRAAVCEIFQSVVATKSASQMEEHLERIEAIIQAGLQDSSVAVRDRMRRVFLSYTEKFPQQGEALKESFPGHVRKALLAQGKPETDQATSRIVELKKTLLEIKKKAVEKDGGVCKGDVRPVGKPARPGELPPPQRILVNTKADKKHIERKKPEAKVFSVKNPVKTAESTEGKRGRESRTLSEVGGEKTEILTPVKSKEKKSWSQHHKENGDVLQRVKDISLAEEETDHIAGKEIS